MPSSGSILRVVLNYGIWDLLFELALWGFVWDRILGTDFWTRFYMVNARRRGDCIFGFTRGLMLGSALGGSSQATLEIMQASTLRSPGIKYSDSFGGGYREFIQGFASHSLSDSPSLGNAHRAFPTYIQDGIL
jgi:hypothetical protein